MQNIVLTVHLILAFSLIIVVLLQRSEGGGLGIGGGGGGGVMSGRSAATALTKLTWGLGIAFVVTSITLTVISARNSGTDSVLDTLGIESSTGGPAIPDPQLGDMPAPAPVPAPAPSVQEGPATPPPVQ